jgi:15-cis-phytoene synthase
MPQRFANTPDLAADLAACRALLRTGSRSFHAAAQLLPRDIADRATALYAFCRLADDAVDEGAGNPAVVELLRHRVEAIYAGRAGDHPADRALAWVVQECGVPREALDALIEGFAWDASNRRYQTLEELEDYGARVAGCVGIMMTRVMGAGDRETLARAADLGVAMQLSNIARDVGEDARNGRIYLPLDWLDEAGIDAERFLARPHFTPELGRLVARLVARADTLYSRAFTGIADLPVSCRIGIRAAGVLYREIGREVMRRGGDSVASRAVVPGSRKLALLACALLPARNDPALRSEPALLATAYLVAAAAGASPRRAAPGGQLAAWWNLPGRLLPVLSIIEKLERLERGGLALPRSQPN